VQILLGHRTVLKGASINEESLRGSAVKASSATKEGGFMRATKLQEERSRATWDRSRKLKDGKLTQN
jgi:hypothetical protein